MSLRKYGTLIFMFILLFHCLSIYLQWVELRFISKLLLVPFLMLILGAFKGFTWKQQSWLPWLGLFGAFIGDLLLALPGDNFFLFGMIGFMTTHFCNSLYFLQLQPLKPGKLKPVLITCVALLFTCSMVVYNIKDQLGPMLFPIMSYMGIISLMTILAANLAASESLKRVAILFYIPGACCFVISDGLLAMNKFVFHEKIMDIPVMITYGLAILLLTLGFINTEWLVKKIPSKNSRG